MKKVWKPQIFNREFYSEILDKKLRIAVTMRTLEQIDKAFGFDFYILKVCSWFRNGDFPSQLWSVHDGNDLRLHRSSSD